MQPPIGPPRDALTAAQVVALVEADEVNVTAGLELLDAGDGFVDDITGDLETGVVECGNYRTIHRTCQLTVARELVWASQRVRPYVTLSSGGVEARFNLGVYLLSTPTANLEDPGTYQVEGYDKLEVLAHPHGAAHSVAAGVAYLTAVTDLLDAAGESRYQVDPDQTSTVLPSAMVWPLDAETTTLQICNDLLAAVNYRALWADWDGVYRLTPYVSPSVQAAEWTYDADDSATTIVGEARSRERDFFAVPNRWVGVRSDATQSIPVDGDGRYETVNQSDGDTSIDSRGRTITRTLFVEAASQASLVAQTDRAKEEDIRVNAYRRFTGGPNPLHWHFDVAALVDAAAGPTTNASWISWTLPLDGGDMTHETREAG